VTHCVVSLIFEDHGAYYVGVAGRLGMGRVESTLSTRFVLFDVTVLLINLSRDHAALVHMGSVILSWQSSWR
jgi:hypothetical protein